MAQNPKIFAIEKVNNIKPDQLLNLKEVVWYNIAGMVPAKEVNTSTNTKASNTKGHPTYTRYLTKEEVFAIEQMFRGMKRRGIGRRVSRPTTGLSLTLRVTTTVSLWPFTMIVD